MKYDDVLAYYGTRKAMASAAGTSTQYVGRWAAIGIIPERFAYRLETDSMGTLKVDPGAYDKQLVEKLKAARDLLGMHNVVTGKQHVDIGKKIDQLARDRGWN